MNFLKLHWNPISFIVLLLFGLATFHCKPEEEIIDFDFTGGLTFSTDTVLFDTLFTGVGSTTRRLKVYNPSKNALRISKIEIGGGISSPFNMLINGTDYDVSHDLVLLGKDSILILIEVLIDPKDEDTPYLVNDYIEFQTNGKQQDVKLVAWGQDANYLGDVVLPCNDTWNSQRPYVLYSSILVDTLCSLTIEKGTQIYAAKDAYIYVKGQLVAEGTADEQIVFCNERLDFQYENIPGQWGGIIFLEGTFGNELSYTSIRNAIYGIRLGAPDNDTIPEIILKNTIIENMSYAGILAFTSDLYAENVLIDNCVEFNCANIAGGNYIYKHCTFGNYSNNFIRQSPSFFITDNFTTTDENVIIEEITVTLQNSIVWGDFEDELFFDFSGGADFQLAFNNNILKSSIEELDTFGNILNQDPKFLDPFQYNYRLDTLSPAKDMGEKIGVLIDLEGNMRDESPDIGAYERLE